MIIGKLKVLNMTYHIKKDGTPGVCHAKNGNCPLGGPQSHFETLEGANEEAQSRLEKQYGGNIIEKSTWATRRDELVREKASLDKAIAADKARKRELKFGDAALGAVNPGLGAMNLVAKVAPDPELSIEVADFNKKARKFKKELDKFKKKNPGVDPFAGSGPNADNENTVKPTLKGAVREKAPDIPKPKVSVSLPEDLDLTGKAKTAYLTRARKVKESEAELNEANDLLKQAEAELKANEGNSDAKAEISIAKSRVTRKKKQLARNKDILDNFVSSL